MNEGIDTFVKDEQYRNNFMKKNKIETPDFMKPVALQQQMQDAPSEWETKMAALVAANPNIALSRDEVIAFGLNSALHNPNNASVMGIKIEIDSTFFGGNEAGRTRELIQRAFDSGDYTEARKLAAADPKCGAKLGGDNKWTIDKTKTDKWGLLNNPAGNEAYQKFNEEINKVMGGDNNITLAGAMKKLEAQKQTNSAASYPVSEAEYNYFSAVLEGIAERQSKTFVDIDAPSAPAAASSPQSPYEKLDHKRKAIANALRYSKEFKAVEEAVRPTDLSDGLDELAAGLASKYYDGYTNLDDLFTNKVGSFLNYLATTGDPATAIEAKLRGFASLTKSAKALSDLGRENFASFATASADWSDDIAKLKADNPTLFAAPGASSPTPTPPAPLAEDKKSDWLEWLKSLIEAIFSGDFSQIFNGWSTAKDKAVDNNGAKLSDAEKTATEAFYNTPDGKEALADLFEVPTDAEIKTALEKSDTPEAFMENIKTAKKWADVEVPIYKQKMKPDGSPDNDADGNPQYEEVASKTVKAKNLGFADAKEILAMSKDLEVSKFDLNGTETKIKINLSDKDKYNEARKAITGIDPTPHINQKNQNEDKSNNQAPRQNQNNQQNKYTYGMHLANLEYVCNVIKNSQPEGRVNSVSLMNSCKNEYQRVMMQTIISSEIRNGTTVSSINRNELNEMARVAYKTLKEARDRVEGNGFDEYGNVLSGNISDVEVPEETLRNMGKVFDGGSFGGGSVRILNHIGFRKSDLRDARDQAEKLSKLSIDEREVIEGIGAILSENGVDGKFSSKKLESKNATEQEKAILKSYEKLQKIMSKDDDQIGDGKYNEEFANLRAAINELPKDNGDDTNKINYVGYTKVIDGFNKKFPQR